MNQSSPVLLRIQERLAELVQRMKDGGLSADEIASVLNGRATAKGMKVHIGVHKVGPLQMMDIRLSPEEAQVLLGDAVTAQPAAQCDGPHLYCPSCKEEALCLKPELLQFAGVSIEKIPPTGACPHCGAFLVVQRQAEPWTFRLMTEDEVLGLSDDERIALQRGRRRAQSRNPANPETPQC